MKKAPNLKMPLEKMSIEETMRYIFGLRNLETQVYLELLARGALTVSEIVKRFKKDRSTLQRALQNLALAGLVYREQKNIKSGGYYFAYRALPLEELKANMNASAKKWYEAMTSWIDAFKL